MTCLGYSQSLIPSIIEVDNSKYYCFDSVGIRKIAVELDNAFTCDSIVDSQSETIQKQDSLIIVKNKIITNLEKQVEIEKAEKLDEEQIIKDKDKIIKKLKFKNTLLIVGDVGLFILIIFLHFK